MKTMKTRNSILLSAAALFVFAAQGHAAIVLHLDANDLVGTVTDGGAVSSWGSVAQGGIVTQAGTSGQPIFDIDGMNGNPTVSFDGGDRLGGLNLPATARSIVAVVTLDTGASSLAGLISNGTDALGVRRNGTAATYRAFSGGANGADFINHDGNASAIHDTFVNGVGGASATFNYDASHVVLANASTAADYSNFTVGYGGTQSRFWLGDISEIYVFDQTLTSDELIGVSSILATRWGSEAITASQAQILAGNSVLGIVPEPSTTALLGLGGLALILRRRR